MGCFVKMLLASFFACTFVKDAAAQGAEVKGSDNAEQFALLCRIYNVAKNPPINHVNVQDPLNIVNEIDALNASFIEGRQFNETEHVGNSSDAQPKFTITREAAAAQAILSRVTQKAHNILEEIRKVNVTRDIEKIKANFSQAIFGKGMNESHLCEGALKDVVDRATACGNSGLTYKGNRAGKNLVVDFFCLCAMRTESNKEGIHDACGMQVGGKNKDAKHGWDTTCPATSSTMWASVKKECGKRLHQHPKSTEEGYEVLKDFKKHLETGGVYRWGDNGKVHGSNRKQGMLGTGMVKKEGGGTDLICDGSRGKKVGNNVNPGGICVYYGSSDWDTNIPWLKKLKTALDSLAILNNQTATLQRNIKKLQILLHRAEEIYETTQVITEVQHPVVPTNLQTAAKRLTAYNAAWRHHPHAHFIFLFVPL